MMNGPNTVNPSPNTAEGFTAAVKNKRSDEQVTADSLMFIKSRVTAIVCIYIYIYTYIQRAHMCITVPKMYNCRKNLYVVLNINGATDFV